MKASFIILLLLIVNQSFCQLNKIDELNGFKDFYFNKPQSSLSKYILNKEYDSNSKDNMYLAIYCTKYSVDNYSTTIGDYKITKVNLVFLYDTLKKIILTIEGNQNDIQKMLEYNFGKPNIKSMNESNSVTTVGSYIWKATNIKLDHNYYYYIYDTEKPNKNVEIHTLTFETNDFYSAFEKIRELSNKNSYKDFQPDK